VAIAQRGFEIERLPRRSKMPCAAKSAGASLDLPIPEFLPENLILVCGGELSVAALELFILSNYSPGNHPLVSICGYFAVNEVESRSASVTS
jgi:hypothetical protein